MLLCVAPVAVQAQSCEWSISGKVIDEHDQSALSYSNIILLETNQYAVADSNGYFIIRQVCSGKYTLIVEHIGCTPDTVTLDLTAGAASGPVSEGSVLMELRNSLLVP